MDMTVHDFDRSRFLLEREIEEVYASAGVLIDPMFAGMATGIPRS
jgi:hypothetical protein